LGVGVSLERSLTIQWGAAAVKRCAGPREGGVVSVPITPVKVGDVVRLKKPHACGANEWEVTKLGMDIGLECVGCTRKVRLLRAEFDRRFRGFIRHAGQPGTGADPGGPRD
jgi:hypothetical protein